jgi:hypothetical protein
VDQTPMVEPAEVDPKTGAASFRISIPLDSIAPGRYTLQSVAVEAGTQQAAFARNYFALRVATPPAPSAAPAAAPASPEAPSEAAPTPAPPAQHSPGR